MLDKNKYAEFLELLEDNRFEYLTGVKLYPWQKLYIKLLIYGKVFIKVDSDKNEVSLR